MRIVEILFYDTNKVKLVVEMPDPNRYTTDHVPHLPRSLFELFPHLADHKCHNEHGYSFRRESMSTEIPHLLEHLIIELQSQAQMHYSLKGETQWNWRVDPRGTFHVHVEYENEQLVLAAIRLAERIVNAVDRREIDQIDTEREIERLRLQFRFRVLYLLVWMRVWLGMPSPTALGRLTETVGNLAANSEGTMSLLGESALARLRPGLTP